MAKPRGELESRPGCHLKNTIRTDIMRAYIRALKVSSDVASVKSFPSNKEIPKIKASLNLAGQQYTNPMACEP